MSDYLPQDILSLFLKRLPAKTILQCRIVCKWWKQVIDSQSFILDHLAVQNPRLLAQSKPFEYLLIDPHTFPKFDTLTSDPIEPYDHRHRYPCMITSVHGVICLYYKRSLRLWNPTIHRLSRNIPLPDFHLNRPTSSEDYGKWFGFWIDPSNNHWKIVIVCFKKRKAYLSSSTRRRWTEVASRIQVEGLRDEPRQVMINGVAHWTAYIRRSWDGVVAYFDFMQDKFGTIEMPALAAYETNVFKWRDSLSLVHFSRCQCDLWAMENGSWSKMFSFKLVDRVMDVLYVEASHSRILTQSVNGYLVLYDPKVRHKRIRLKSEFIGTLNMAIAYEFVESLVFPDV